MGPKIAFLGKSAFFHIHPHPSVLVDVGAIAIMQEIAMLQSA
jgi:hypothetical protein